VCIVIVIAITTRIRTRSHVSEPNICRCFAHGGVRWREHRPPLLPEHERIPSINMEMQGCTAASLCRGRWVGGGEGGGGISSKRKQLVNITNPNQICWQEHRISRLQVLPSDIEHMLLMARSNKHSTHWSQHERQRVHLKPFKPRRHLQGLLEVWGFGSAVSRRDLY
jgi:hypothetical protein